MDRCDDEHGTTDGALPYSVTFEALETDASDAPLRRLLAEAVACHLTRVRCPETEE